MIDLIKSVRILIEENKKDFFRYLTKVTSHDKKLLVKGDLFDIFEKFKNDDEKANFKAIEEVIHKINESVSLGNSLYFEIREKIANSQFYHFNIEEHFFEVINVREYLKVKERFVNPNGENNILSINFSTFYDKFPSIRESKSIGRGVEYLNRYLSSNMFTQPEKLRKALFDFLFVHKHNAEQLILNSRINTPEQLSNQIDRALSFLRKKDEEEPYNKFKHQLQELGFEPGLGDNVGRIVESLEMLDGLLQTPDHQALKEFLSRIPMIFNITIVSVHGYFGQEGVLGKPDTGGQVVYILDQVKALEQKLIKSLKESGLNAKPKIIILTRLIPNADNTMSNKRLEKVHKYVTSRQIRDRLQRVDCKRSVACA